MSDNANSENVIDPHSALASLWPSDSEESRKLAEEKHQKRQNLTTLGAQFKQAREALGYNISDLGEHTGLSFTELEALEQGQFQHIEQQDYVDYYVHTYAGLLGLDPDIMLHEFQQNYYQNENPSPNAEPAQAFDISDETQYEDAFADEAKKTIEALEASGVNVLEAAPQPATDDADQAEAAELLATAPEITLENPQYAKIDGVDELQATHQHEPITSDPQSNQNESFPWLKLTISFAFVVAAAYGVYLINNQFNPLRSNGNSNQVASINTADINTPITESNDLITGKDSDRVPDAQKVKKLAILESKIVTQGSNNLNAPTADSVQKPLVLLGQQASTIINDSPTADANPIADANNEIDNIVNQVVQEGQQAAQDIVNAAESNIETAIANATNTETSDAETSDVDTTNATTSDTETSNTNTPNVEISDDLAKAAELAAAAAAAKTVAEDAAKAEDDANAQALPEATTAQLPEDPIQEALSQLPSETSKYSLHATKNSWLLIEDDSAQILFSDELTPDKIITLPKIQGVIISLADAGVIEVYKGKTLVGRLGAPDESLDLVSIEQRINQISN